MTYLKGLLTAVVFTALAVGFAYAMPAVVNTAARVPTQLDPLVTPSILPSHTQTATVPTPTPTPTPTPEPEPDDDEDKQHPDNHGAAVSTAAHCPIKGRAHGELVRSIAQDKGATVADAEAACAAALAAAAAEPAKEKGKPERAERVKPTKPPKPGKEPRAPKPDKTGGNGKARGKP